MAEQQQLGIQNGVTRAAYVSGGAVQITSVSFPLRAVVLPVAGSPGFVLMSGPETEAFLGCVVVSSVRRFDQLGGPV